MRFIAINDNVDSKLGSTDDFIDNYRNTTLKEMHKALSATKSEQEKIRFRISEINSIIQKLYEDNVNGRITDEHFDLLSKTYENEQAELRNKENLLKESVRNVEREEQNLTRFVRIVKSTLTWKN